MSPEKLVYGILLTLICRCPEVVDSARARVTLHMTLSNKIQGSCDESAYKVDICAKEFTTECRQEERYLQDVCAPSSVTESISFDVQHVESSIEISGTVLKVGDKEVIVLRTTEFLLTDRKEIDITSFDLLLIIRFRVNYICLRNYFGKLCNKFCDQSAEEHICDEWGNMHCKLGYFMDIKSGKCRKDQCLHMSSHCLNNGTCVNNQGPVTGPPKCLCPNDYTGARCEHLVISTTTTIRWTAATSEPDFEQTTTVLPWHSNATNVVAPATMTTTAQVPLIIGAIEGPAAPLEEDDSRSQVESPVSVQEKDVVVAKTSQMLISNDKKSVKSSQFSDSKRGTETRPVVQTAGIAAGLLGVLIISITLLLLIGICLATWYVHLRRRKNSSQSGGDWSSPAKFSNWMITCAPKPLNLTHQQQLQVTGDCQPYSPSGLHPPPPPPAFTPTYFANTETGELLPDPMATPLTVHHHHQPWRSSAGYYPWDSNQPVYGQTATHLTTLPRVPRSLQLNTFLPNSEGEVTSVLDPVGQSAYYGTPSHFASSVHRQSRPPGRFFSSLGGDAGWAGSQLLPVSAYGSPPLILPQSDYHAQSPVAVNELDLLGQQLLTNSYMHMPLTTATYSRVVEASQQQQVYGSSQPDLGTGSPDEAALLIQSPVVGSIQPPAPYLNPSPPFQFVDNPFQRTDI